MLLTQTIINTSVRRGKFFLHYPQKIVSHNQRSKDMSVMAINAYACRICEQINTIIKSVILTIQEGRQLDANAKIAPMIMHEYPNHTLPSLIHEINMKTRGGYNVKRDKIDNQ